MLSQIDRCGQVLNALLTSRGRCLRGRVALAGAIETATQRGEDFVSVGRSVFNGLATSSGDTLAGVVSLLEDGRKFGILMPHSTGGKLILQGLINDRCFEHRPLDDAQEHDAVASIGARCGRSLRSAAATGCDL